VLAENINLMSVELKKKIEDEKRAEKTKNELITNVSHDLKTPLTTIIGYLSLLTEKKYDHQDSMD
jgi:K+-sensing histidine kinase KdpD